MNLELMTPDNYIVEPDEKFGDAYVSIPILTSITPQMYLEFAVNDFENYQGTRSCINAFANAKRAIDLQTDILSKAFGIDLLSVELKNSFPMKMDFCEKCGFVGRRTLIKYYKIKNKLEHEYYAPQPIEVEEVIVVAQLFLAAAERFMKFYPTNFDFDLNPKPGFDIPNLMGAASPPNEGVIYLFPDLDEVDKSTIDLENIRQWQKDRSFRFKASDGSLYFSWVSFLFAHS